MLIHASLLLEKRDLSKLQRRTLAAVISNLARWDPLLADRLAAEGSDEILRPARILCEVRKERGWTEPLPSAPDDLWCRGCLDVFEGRPTVHSAALAPGEGSREIDRRIWSAEVGVILPYIEERRRELLDHFAPVLRVPWRKATGELITDRRDLEVGHIENQLRYKAARIDDKTIEFVGKLRQARNHLSHLEPLPASLILDGRLEISPFET